MFVGTVEILTLFDQNKFNGLLYIYISRVQSPGGAPKIFQRPSSAKKQLDVIRMRL